MKGMRKGLSLVMAFLLALSLLPVSPFTMPAWAGTGSTATGSDAELEDGNVLPVSTAADAEETSLKDAALLPAAFEKSAVIDGVKITVSAAPGVFPDGAQLKVQKVDLPEVDAAVESERDANASVKQKYTFDIKIFNKAGNEIEPDEEYGKASVTFTLADVPEKYDSISVYHVKGEESGLTAEKLDTEVSGEGGSGKVSASVKTDSFSYFDVELETLAGATENTVVNKVSNATVHNESYTTRGSATIWSATLQADTGYLLPPVAGITVTSNNETKYTNWEHEQDGYGFTYVLSNDLSSATINIYKVEGNVTVSGTAVVPYYTVNFDSNAPLEEIPSGTMAAQMISVDVATALTANAFKVSGYGFTGWNTKADGSGTTYADKAEVTNLIAAKEEITLYAQWVAEYTVNFDANAPSGTASGTIAPQTIFIDVATALTANSFSVTGYKFTGWNTQADGKGKAYTNKEKVTNLAPQGVTITLYAQWAVANGNYWYITGNVLHIGTLSSDIPSAASYWGTFSGGGYQVPDNMPPWYQYGDRITGVIVDKTCILPSSTALWFFNLTKMTSCNVSNLDTSNVTNMYAMFSGCSDLRSLDLSKFDTSKVTNMYSMFSGCSGLQSLDLSKFDTSNVTTMSGMFFGCSKLQSLDLSNFDTSNVTNMGFIFAGCSSLNSVTFGPDFAFKGNDVVLPTPAGNGYTGKWIKKGGTAYTPAALATLTGADLQGTWVAELKQGTGTGTGSGGAEWTNGWSTNGKRYYLKGTFAANTWVQVDGKWYHFNSKGYMQTGWVLDGGKWYYLDPTTGVMAAGLVTADGYNYYFNADGSMAVGDVVINGVTHHFNDTKPTAPTYVFDQETETYKPIDGNTQTPYGAETTA